MRTLSTQRTSACNTSSDDTKVLLGGVAAVTSLVCSRFEDVDEPCSSNSLVVETDLLAPLKKISNGLCERTLLIFHNLIVLLAFHMTFKCTDTHI